MATTPPASSTPKGGAVRPQLSAQMRTSSFLREHQQYRPPKSSSPETHYGGIDTVVEDVRPPGSPPKSFVPFKGVPSDESPPTIVEGLNHDLTHENCAPVPSRKTSRLVATLFYKRHSRPAATTASPPATAVTAAAAADAADAVISKLSTPAQEQLPANLAPTDNINNFPLEPPSGSQEHLDHLYGTYISPLCITAFLHLMSGFPHGRDAVDTGLHSSHRCLDNPEQPRVVELTLSPAPSPDYLSLADLRKHESIYRFEKEWNVEVVLQAESIWRRHPRLVVFDMDSTLITQEVIDLLAATVTDRPDLAERVADITHRAMMGELEFDGAFRERVKLLTGVSADVFERLRPVLDVTAGVPALIKALRRLGVRTAVLSGGFLPLTSWLAGELGINHAHANEVVIDEATGALTGEVKGVIIGKERKRELLLEIAEKEGIDTSQVIAVGDGANDLLMMEAAALGVAWNAKPVVQMEASARLNGDSLLDLLYLFGFTREDIELLSE